MKPKASIVIIILCATLLLSTPATSAEGGRRKAEGSLHPDLPTSAFRLLPTAFLLGGPSAVAAAQPSVDARGLFSVKKAPRGGTFQGAVILGIPNGYHINSNRPTSKFMIPTTVRVTAPRGVRVGPVRYPRANVRTFSFAPDERLPVFEGNPAVRFDVTVPAAYAQDKIRLRVVVSYQACSDEACFRPAERDMTLSIDVADDDDEIQNINGNVFGRLRRRGR